MTGYVTAEPSSWEVCRTCWQRHLDIEAEERRAADEEIRRLTATIRLWLSDAPTIDVSDSQVKELIKLGVGELFDLDDLAGVLAKALVFGRTALCWAAEDAIHGTHYECVLAKTEYRTSIEPVVYLGSVFRADERRMCIRWTPEAFYTT
jgi:hypothetical protein